MRANGRTMRQAMNEGSAYQAVIEGWAGAYFPPAAETPADVCSCVQSLYKSFGKTPPAAVLIERVISGQIGGLFVEVLGRFDVQSGLLL